jgi:NADP-dependent 3-hydroxy acid dehydrogenase YdfG
MRNGYCPGEIYGRIDLYRARGVHNAEKGRVEGGSMADSYLDPEAIAQSYLHVVRQPRSAWTWKVELRPWPSSF